MSGKTRRRGRSGGERRRPARSEAAAREALPGSPPRHAAGRPGRAGAAPGRWVAIALLREAIRRLHEGWKGLPGESTRAWWRTVLPGAVGVLLLSLALVALARHLAGAGRLAWEEEAMGWIATRAPVSFNAALWMEGPGNGFVLWLLMLYAAAVAAWKGKPLRAIAFLVGYTGVYPPIVAGWLAWDRARPTLIAGGIATPGGFFHSYPSGHMVQAVFAYGLLAWLWARAARSRGERAAAACLLLLAGGVVAIGRLRVGAHWPSDIVAGALIGAAWLAVVISALSRAERPLRGERRARRTRTA